MKMPPMHRVFIVRGRSFCPPSFFCLLLEHRHLYPFFPGYFPRDSVACIRMPHDPYSRISSQHPYQLARRLWCSIGDETHSRVNAVAHSDTAALMHAHPSRTCSRVQQRVQDRPISDSITTIKHTFSLSTRRGHASTVKMVPSNPDRPSKLPPRHHLVYQSTKLSSLSEARPAHSSRQTLELHLFLSFPNPPRQALALRKGREN